MLGPAVEPSLLTIVIDPESKLRRDHYIIAHWRQRLAHQLFVGERPIHFGRVEQGHTALDRGAYQRDHLGAILGRTIAVTHAHAAEAQGGYFEASEFSSLHYW